MHFFPIEATYGWKEPFPPVESWPWRSLNFFLLGLTEITPYGIEQMKLSLQAQPEVARDYLIAKTGYNSSDVVEAGKAIDSYVEYGLITEGDETYPYFCQMSNSILLEEVKECIAQNKPENMLKGSSNVLQAKMKQSSIIHSKTTLANTSPSEYLK